MHLADLIDVWFTKKEVEELLEWWDWHPLSQPNHRGLCEALNAKICLERVFNIMMTNLKNTREMFK